MLVFFSVLYNPDDNALNNIRFAKSLGVLPVVFLNKVNFILSYTYQLFKFIFSVTGV